MTLVTVVVSFYNNADTIADCVRSVFAQTFADWRLILLDDGSTDGGFDEVSGIRDPRVTVLRGSPNLGTPVRLNQLTEMVTTPYLARMDGDDLMYPTRLERAVDVLEEDPSLSMVHGAAVSIDLNNEPRGWRLPVDESVQGHFRCSPYIHSTVTARTDWWRAHPYDPDYRRCQDQELWVRTLGARKSYQLEGVQVYLREAGTIPASKYATSMRGTRRVIRQYGRQRLGATGAARAAALTVAKQGAYWAAERLGAVDRLVAGRAEGLTPDELARHRKTVHELRTTAVQGLGTGD
jgi:glycosyltransferase involved in cell wall biosynthesis